MGRFTVAPTQQGGLNGGGLFAEVAALESIAKQTGARPPKQDSPGIFRRVVDILSRVEFAEAGYLEETLGDNTPAGQIRGLKRAGRELFSGVGRSLRVFPMGDHVRGPIHPVGLQPVLGFH